jgi:hypothetical protein
MNTEDRRNQIREALEALEQEGRLTPDAVVEAARDPLNPLHAEFEWDNQKAAHRFRVEQARTIIASVRMVVIEESRVLVAPAYVRDPDARTGEQGYVRTATLSTDRERSRGALKNEIARADAYIQRVAMLAAAFGLDGEVQDVRERLALVAKALVAA